MSGRRGSNPPPEAWKATALPNELLPHFLVTGFRKGINIIENRLLKVGADGFEPPKV